MVPSVFQHAKKYGWCMNRLTLTRFCLIVLIACSSVSRLAMASSDTGTLLVGLAAPGTCTNIHYYGYESSLMGSYSPTGLTGGDTVSGVYDQIFLPLPPNCTGTNTSWLHVSGFSADPGRSWLTSIACNGQTNNGTGATYSYSSGVATWSWSNLFGFVSKEGSNVSCTIIHT